MSRLLDLAARRGRFVNLLFTGLGLALAGYYWYILTTTGGAPVDVHAYWAADPNNLYPPAASTLHQDAYLYSPAFELVVGWGRNLSFEAFTAIWRAVLCLTLVWLAGPFTLFVLFLYPVASEINAGNIQLLAAAAIVLAFRGVAMTGRGPGERGREPGLLGRLWPGMWAFVLLTKVTPGIGLLWFAARRQWRALAVALGATALIAAATFALWPDRWLAWLQLLQSGGTPEPLSPFYLPFWPRFIGAAAIVLIGAWRGWRWPVIVGATLALPAFYTISPSMLVGVLPFLRQALARWSTDRAVAGGWATRP